MAYKLTSKEKQVSEIFLRYYGENKSLESIKALIAENKGSVKKILKEVKLDMGNTNPTEQINDVFNNIFGRNASETEIAKYIKSAEKGKLNIAKIIAKAPK